jgi:hypothetical protein
MLTTHPLIRGAAEVPVRAVRPAPHAPGRLKILLLTALLPFLMLAGCAVQFVSPYDVITDEAIQGAILKAETIFSKVTVANAPYAQVRTEYRELEAMLNVISTRAAMGGTKNQYEQGLVTKLKEEMADLEAFHRNVAPYRASRIASTRVIFASLLHHEKGKKAASGGSTEGGGR